MDDFADAPSSTHIEVRPLLLKWNRMIAGIMAIEKARAHDVFRLFDHDDDQRLTLLDVYAAARHFNLGFSIEDIKAIFGFLDRNHDGQIDPMEFTKDIRMVHVASDFSPSHSAAGARTSKMILRDLLEQKGPSRLDSRSISLVEGNTLRKSSSLTSLTPMRGRSASLQLDHQRLRTRSIDSRRRASTMSTHSDKSKRNYLELLGSPKSAQEGESHIPLYVKAAADTSLASESKQLTPVLPLEPSKIPVFSRSTLSSSIVRRLHEDETTEF